MVKCVVSWLGGAPWQLCIKQNIGDPGSFRLVALLIHVGIWKRTPEIAQEVFLGQVWRWQASLLQRLPRSIQSGHSPFFVARVTQLVSPALGTCPHLCTAWRPQSSGKVEKANQTLKRTLAKLCQETSEPWTKLLPTALLRIRAAPKIGLRLSPFGMTGRR